MRKNQNYPKISIVTPSFNQGDYIEETICSILSQNYPNLQYIIIDGGSTDRTLRIVKKYQKYLSYWVSEKDSGQGEAINKGLCRASGDILAWLNSDDILMPRSLSLVASIFTTIPEVHWITGNPTVITNEGQIIYVQQNTHYFQPFIKRGYYYGAYMGFLMQEGTFWSKRLFDTVGNTVPLGKYALDYLLWRQFASHSPVTCVNTSLAAYRLNPNRKNNDNHSNYYREIGVSRSPAKRILGKILYKVISVVDEAVHIVPTISYDQKQSAWVYQYHKKHIVFS